MKYKKSWIKTNFADNFFVLLDHMCVYLTWGTADSVK